LVAISSIEFESVRRGICGGDGENGRELKRLRKRIRVGYKEHIRRVKENVRCVKRIRDIYMNVMDMQKKVTLRVPSLCFYLQEARMLSCD